MEITSLVIVAVVLLNLALALWLIARVSRLSRTADTSRVDTAMQLLKAELIGRQAESLTALRESIDSANRIVNERLAEGASAIDRRMSTFGEIENKLGQLTEQAAGIASVGKNVQMLSELLRPPRSRGRVGELMLENLLGQILPRSLYETQYRFPDGLRVDAVVRLGDRLLPVDAKFPLESYERLVAQPDDAGARREFTRTLKKHVDAIASRYLKPGEQTTDFAVMYIPAEAVYYQLIADKDGSAFEYALSKKIIPSSPGHFYGFLASVAAVYSEVSLAQASVERGNRWLVTGINELTETSVRLERLHERMEASLRSLTAALEKSRSELRQIRLNLEKLGRPEDLPGEPVAVSDRQDTAD
ncbi:MAG TPA: DNA recombination protein RmuC [Acidobacteriota bacterium]|nr:DNA recombination protein RmuC [Acidobacteriota bacterium]